MYQSQSEAQNYEATYINYWLLSEMYEIPHPLEKWLQLFIFINETTAADKSTINAEHRHAFKNLKLNKLFDKPHYLYIVFHSEIKRNDNKYFFI